MRVPHSLSLDEVRQEILVADREDSRVLCYTTDGKFLHQINTGGRVYGISYSPVTGKLNHNLKYFNKSNFRPFVRRDRWIDESTLKWIGVFNEGRKSHQHICTRPTFPERSRCCGFA